jgi:HAE1 family hydrophobic/amphiphilic exporter-1
VNPADSPIIFFSFTSDLMPLSQLDEYAETFMAQRISMVPGVAQVNVYGSQKYAVRVQLDPTALVNRKLGIDEVASAITSQNVNLPTGILNGPNKTYTVQANGQLQDAASFRRMVVAYRNGAPIHLGDLGNVLDDVQNSRAAAWFREKRGLILAVQRQPGSNTVAVADAVNDLVNKLKPQLPGGVEINKMIDRSVTIRESVHDVKFTLVLTLFLVIAVIFVFLRNVSATVIPSLALPISVIGTFAVMYLLDYSMDNLSLMALTLAVGFVVDDAIVMLENIVRHMEMGKPPMQAAVDGATEVGFTIISMTLSLTAVFIPILFLGGIIGRLFHEFAVVIAVSILVSGFVSLTLTPMLSSRFLRPHAHDEKHGRLYNLTESGYEWLVGKYETSLLWVMEHRRVALVFSLFILVGTIGLFAIIPKGFIPSQDNGNMFATTETAQGTSFDDMVAHQKQIAAIVAQDTNIAGFMSAVGGSSSISGSNQGRLFMGLPPRDKRLSVDEIIRKLRPKLAKVPGVVVYMQNPPAIQIGGRVS